MRTVLRNTHWEIPRDLLDTAKVEADLTIVNGQAARARKLGYAADRLLVHAWELSEDEKVWRLPRAYAPPFLDRVRVQYDLPHFPKTESWGFHRVLRPHQIPAVEALARQTGDKFLVLACGKGKTTVAIRHAAGLRRKTLIVVDRDFLIDQWKREIVEATDIREEEIGVIQGSEDNTVGTRVTIAMLHTLARHADHIDDFVDLDQFGLVIFDEAHVLAADSFGKVLPLIAGQRLLLSATPIRNDGLEGVFMLHAGGFDLAYVDLTRTMSSTWIFRSVNPLSEAGEARCFMRDPRDRFLKKDSPCKPRYVLSRAKYDSAAAASRTWNEDILGQIHRDVTEHGRRVLILGSRVEQLKYLHDGALKLGLDSGLVHGKVRKTRAEQLTKQVVFVTTSIGGKALDIDTLDTLYLLFPSADLNLLQQAEGRITREYEGKMPPIVRAYSHKALQRQTDAMKSAVRQLDGKATIINASAGKAKKAKAQMDLFSPLQG